MKINIKAKAEPTVQRNLRLPLSLNKQMSDTSTLAQELGIDYYATLLGALEQFNSEFDARLREMKLKDEGSTPRGIIAGRESLPAPAAQKSSVSSNAASISAANFAGPSPAGRTPANPAMASSNRSERDRA
jgi:hypothetical protein